MGLPQMGMMAVPGLVLSRRMPPADAGMRRNIHDVGLLVLRIWLVRKVMSLEDLGKLSTLGKTVEQQRMLALKLGVSS